MANVEMFKRIRDQIKRDPKTFSVGSWEFNIAKDAENYGDFDVNYYDPALGDYEVVSSSECGTTRCVAGWGIYFAAMDAGFSSTAPLRQLLYSVADVVGVPWSEVDYAVVGAKVLDIPQAEASKLFYSSDSDGYEIVNEYAEGVRS